MRDIDEVREKYFEMQLYLPIAFKQEANHDTYLEQLAVNFERCLISEAYQFAYFSAYLTFMSFINYTAWLIAKTYPQRFSDAMIGLKPYKKEDANKFLDLENLEVYFFGLMAEKDVMELFRILEYDPNKLKGFVDDRNEIAHASGKITAKTLDELYITIHAMLVEMKNLYKIKKQIFEVKHISKMIEFVTAGYTEPKEYDDYFEDLIINQEISFKEFEYLQELSYKKYIPDKMEDRDLRAKSVKEKLSMKFSSIHKDYYGG